MPAWSSQMQTQMVHNAEEHRYEILVEGESAGYTQYHRFKGALAFIHTEIDVRFEGRGLASTLVRGALDDARRRGESVLPFCPFVRGFINKHREYVDLVPTDDREHFGL